VVRSVHVSVQRKGTFAIAIESGITVRSNNPILEIKIK